VVKTTIDFLGKTDLGMRLPDARGDARRLPTRQAESHAD
jgi:hypothetical protein